MMVMERTFSQNFKRFFLLSFTRELIMHSMKEEMINFESIINSRKEKKKDEEEVLTKPIVFFTENFKKPEIKEKYIGRATVRTTFKVSRIGTIAGCFVSDGVVMKNAKVRLIRDNVVVRDDLTIASLKHFKDDAREVRAGLECGIKLTDFDDVKTDDVLDFYEMVKMAGTLQ